MYKGSKKLDESSINKSVLNSTILSETTNQIIQRDIDNYTRILEQDKRKFFRVQENRNDIIKEYAQKTKELDLLKSRQFKTETMKKKGEVKILERELDSTINSYNEVIANNKKLKSQIDELRKEKLNQKEAMRRLNAKIEEYSLLLEEKHNEISKKKCTIQQAKHEILSIKLTNQIESKQFREEVINVKTNLTGNKSRNYLFKRKSQMDQKNEATDTQPLVKYRLRQLINKNKQRMKIIQTYRKTMQAIWKSFQEIKEESGINDLQEITNTFIKHQEQNHFIYEYINKLNKEIEDLNDESEEIKKKIENQKELNQNYEKQLGITPQKLKRKELNAKFTADCKEKINYYETFLKETDAVFKQIKTFLPEQCEADFTQFNMEHQLSKIQEMINQYYKQEECKSVYKEEATKYTKIPPGVNDELREVKEEKLFQSEKLREFASDYWQKRKAKMEVK